MLITVASASDQRLAPYISVRERDLVQRDNRFIVEGAITLERLLTASRFPPESIFLCENRVSSLSALLARIDPAIPVYVASQEVVDSVAGFHLHRGVLAIARRGAEPTCDELLAGMGAATILSLVTLANHDNVGACFRNAAAFGAGAVLLDAASADPLYRKSIRVSAGAALSLPFARSGDGAAMLDALDRHGFETWALTPRDGEPLQSLAPPPRLSLMLGAEGPGLPPALMARARRVTIPMSPGLDSLNVATAGAVALAHVFAARGATSRS